MGKLEDLPQPIDRQSGLLRDNHHGGRVAPGEFRGLFGRALDIRRHGEGERAHDVHNQSICHVDIICMSHAYVKALEPK